jgi:hypothetical protein
MNAWIITLAIGMSVLLTSCRKVESSPPALPAPRFSSAPEINNPLLGSRSVTATVVNDGGSGTIVFSVQSVHSNQTWSVKDTIDAGQQKTLTCECPGMPSDSAFTPSVCAAP